MKIKRLALATMVAFTLNGSPVFAGGGIGVPVGATELTQLQNNAELIAIYAKEAEAVANQIKQYQTMLENFKKLPSFAQTGLKADILKLQSILQAGEALNYAASNIEGDFKSKFKGAYGFDAPMTKQEWLDHHKKLTETTQDSVLSALKAANLQAQMFESEAGTLETLESQLSTATGTNAILQAGGAIAAQTAASMQKMRQLTASNMQMNAAKIAADEDRRAATAAKLKELGTNTKLNIDSSTAPRINANDLF